MQKYRILGKKGEGTFSEVLKCQNDKNEQFACKRMKQSFNSIDQVNNLREIQCMRRLSPHANIVDLKEVIFDKKSGTLALIIELMDMNLYELIRGRRQYLPEKKCQNYIYQTLKALDHMHRNGIFHRDIKPENILLKGEVVKLADFGSCRSVYSKQPYTEYISTRWYRAPECLLTDGYYTYKMDIWSVGCVMAEILSLHPLFPGSNEVDQVHRIHNVVGSPSAELLSKFKKSKHMEFNFPAKTGTGIAKAVPASESAVELIAEQCTYDPDDRPSAKQILRKAYFKSLRDEDKRKARVDRAQHMDVGSNRKKESVALSSSINKPQGGFLMSLNNPSTINKPEYKPKHTLPKIPIAAAPLNSNNKPLGIPKKFSTLPSINNLSTKDDKAKLAAADHSTKRTLGYSQYALPSLNKLSHAPP